MRAEWLLENFDEIAAYVEVDEIEYAEHFALDLEDVKDTAEVPPGAEHA